MPGDGEPVKAGHALLLRALQVGEVVLGALAREATSGEPASRARERHDAVLRGAQAGVEGFFQSNRGRPARNVCVPPDTPGGARSGRCF